MYLIEQRYKYGTYWTIIMSFSRQSFAEKHAQYQSQLYQTGYYFRVRNSQTNMVTAVYFGGRKIVGS